MLTCPADRTALENVRTPQGQLWACPACGGRVLALATLRRVLPPESVEALWGSAPRPNAGRACRCPSCDGAMEEVEVTTPQGALRLDLCRRCQFIWFDPGEFQGALGGLMGPETARAGPTAGEGGQGHVPDGPYVPKDGWEILRDFLRGRGRPL